MRTTSFGRIYIGNATVRPKQSEAWCRLSLSTKLDAWIIILDYCSFEHFQCRLKLAYEFFQCTKLEVCISLLTNLDVYIFLMSIVLVKWSYTIFSFVIHPKIWQAFLHSVRFACQGICISNKSVTFLKTLLVVPVEPVHCCFFAFMNTFLRWQMHTLLQEHLQFLWHVSPTARELYAWFLTYSLLQRNNAKLCHVCLRTICIH